MGRATIALSADDRRQRPVRPGPTPDASSATCWSSAVARRGLSAAVTAAYHGLDVIVAEKALGAGRGDRLVRRLDVGAAEPAVAGRRHRRGRRRAAHLPQARAGRATTTSRGWRPCCRTAGTWSAFFENHTALQFVSGSWIADIQGDLPGAGTGGRSVGPEADQRAPAAQGPAAAGPAAAVRDVIPGHGHHGRPRPAGLPAHHDDRSSPSSTPPGGSRSTCST